jgi:adenylate cyclase
MGEQRVQRKLAAMLAADVVCYSRLVEANETDTLAAFKKHLTELIEPSIKENRGRLVKTMGDGVLAEFGSAVDAVLSARSIQEGMGERNAEIPEERKILFRIGVNVGDIVIDGDDLQGDGVNIAARLEGIAEPGGICISGTVYDQVHGKLDLGFSDLGEQEVKNIARPVRAYKVTAVRHAPKQTVRKTTRWKKTEITVVLTALLAVAGGLTWWQPWMPDVEPASIDKMLFKLPDKPSIAVLPFTNMSGAADQEYFADGITEDIITDISKISGIFVVARNPTFTYKGKAVKVRQIAEDFGVRYVLEGSVRRAGNKLRITANLIDVINGKHLWAQRYDRDVKDVFAVQTEVAE